MQTHVHRRNRVGIGLAAIPLLAAGALVAGPDRPARGESGSAPIAVEVLASPSSFPDRVQAHFRRKLPGAEREVLRLGNPSNIVVARLTLRPGARFPWHTHPGPVVVSVVSGGLVYQQRSDCVPRGYAAGESFLDPGNRTHTAWNNSEGATVLVATFYDVPEQGALTLPTTRQDFCQG